MAFRLILSICASLAINLILTQNLDQLRQSVTSEDQRAFIKINVLLDTAPRVVAAQLETALPDGHMKERTVYTWYGNFKQGKRTDVSDRPIPGRPREVTTEYNKEKVRQLILESEGMRTEDLLYETGFSESSLLRILSEINARKIKSRWLPHELTERQMNARHHIASKLLARYQREGDRNFIDKIIAIDETWVKSHDPQDSRQSSEWLLPGQKA
jgi:hypothetical protein